ncbi:MAG: hypothetical protein ABUT20_31480 [Bacteroidota bacterium]
MKRYTTWLKTAAVFQLIAAIMHSISLFVSLTPNNETEKQLFTLMDTYKFDFGTGFHRTMGELTLVFSACLFLLCLLAGLQNWYLLRKKVDTEIMKGVITINLIVFGILFCLTAIFTFLLPIIQIGLIVLFLILSRISIRKNS